jgi:ankyrin repeat protein
MTRDRAEINRQFEAVDGAYRAGNLAALRLALGNPNDFPNSLQPSDLGVGDYPLEYAIYWSPLSFIESIIAIGADPDYPDRFGFPSLIAALSSGRPDRHDIVRLLLESGADVDQRGLNDWTALHYAVVQRDLRAVEMLLAHGADPLLRTRIDDGTSPLEDAEAIGFEEAAALLYSVPPPGRGAGQ